MPRSLLVLLCASILFAAFGAWMLFETAHPNRANASAEDNRDQVCPLSDSQQQNAADAFAVIASMVKGEPRCNNCHGAVDPFAADTTHVGGRMDPLFETKGPRKGIRDDLATRIFQCQECHLDKPHLWTVPFDNLWFTNKDAVKLCRRWKLESQQPRLLIAHLDDDPFAEAAFAGTRALNDNGQQLYEEKTGKPYRLEPPGFKKGELINNAQNWIDAMGGKYVGDIECGCKPHHYALLVKENLKTDFSQQAVKIHWDASTQVQIPLSFDDDLSFSGKATSQRALNATVTAKISCTANTSVPVNWKASGKFDEKNKKLQIKIEFTQTAHTLACGPLPVPVPIDDTENARNPLKNLELSSFIGDNKTVKLNFSIPNSRPDDSFQVTLIKLD